MKESNFWESIRLNVWSSVIGTKRTGTIYFLITFDRGKVFRIPTFRIIFKNNTWNYHLLCLKRCIFDNIFLEWIPLTLTVLLWVAIS